MGLYSYIDGMQYLFVGIETGEAKSKGREYGRWFLQRCRVVVSVDFSE